MLTLEFFSEYHVINTNLVSILVKVDLNGTIQYKKDYVCRHSKKIVKINNPETNLAMVDVNGVKHQVNIAYLVDADHPVGSCVGDWALIYMGLAMNCVSEDEVAKTLELLRELGEVQLQMDAMLNN